MDTLMSWKFHVCHISTFRIYSLTKFCRHDKWMQTRRYEPEGNQNCNFSVCYDAFFDSIMYFQAMSILRFKLTKSINLDQNCVTLWLLWPTQRFSGHFDSQIWHQLNWRCTAELAVYLYGFVCCGERSMITHIKH